MNPQLYGKEHITYIIICMVVAIAVCICAKLFIKTEKAKKIFMKCAGLVLFAVIFANRLALVFERTEPNWLKLLTDSFCSTTSYVMSLALIFGKKNNSVLQFTWLIALAGGVITTFYSNFIGQNPSFLYPPTILGMLHHTISAVIVVLMFILKYINLTYKRWKCTVIGFISYLAYGAFLMCVLGYSNPFYMTAPAISGTVFTAWVIAPIYIVVYAVILLIVELVRKYKKNKKSVA